MNHDVALGRGRPQSLSARRTRDPATLAAAVGQQGQLATQDGEQRHHHVGLIVCFRI